jgi:hypothetical protein
VSIGGLNSGGCVAASATATPYHHLASLAFFLVGELHCKAPQERVHLCQTQRLQGTMRVARREANVVRRMAARSRTLSVVVVRVADDTVLCRYTGLV